MKFINLKGTLVAIFSLILTCPTFGQITNDYPTGTKIDPLNKELAEKLVGPASEVQHRHVGVELDDVAGEEGDKFLSSISRYRDLKFSTPENPVNFNHPELYEAPKIYSDPITKELYVTLDAQYAWHTFSTFVNNTEVRRELYLRGYNGDLVGPTLVARPGDTLKIRLVNSLPPEANPPPCDEHGHCDHNQPHNFNTTNLHTHGLHVDPTGNSDNIFIKVANNEAFDYEIKIPNDHVAGTFWYHAHVHGATSVQIGSGMSGALVIKGDYDQLRSIKNANSKIFMLQEIAYDENGRIENNDTFAPTAWDDNAVENGWHISVNGQVMPEMTVHPGELQHWRLIAGGVRKNLNLKLYSPCFNQYIPLTQIAADGIPFRKKRQALDDGVFLAPGYRNDVLTRLWIPGTYYLVDTNDPNYEELSTDYCDWYLDENELRLDSRAQNIIARIVVNKEFKRFIPYPRNSELLSLNRPRSISDEELSQAEQELIFDIDISVSPWKGLINGKAYDPNQPRILPFNHAQTWRVSSVFSHHPYHIHVNPFEVIERDSEGRIVDRYWKDTIIINQIDEGDLAKEVVELRMRYEDFKGAFVTHCHILDHEDHGMMEKIVIQ